MDKINYADQGVATVAEFHEAFGCGHATSPYIPPIRTKFGLDRLDMYAERMRRLGEDMKMSAASLEASRDPGAALIMIRMQLLVEESAELMRAVILGDMVKVLDGLSDITYVNNGNYLTFGMGHLKPAADAETHRSNMSKLDPDGKPILDLSGRVVKPPNYSKPDFASILEIAA